MVTRLRNLNSMPVEALKVRSSAGCGKRTACVFVLFVFFSSQVFSQSLAYPGQKSTASCLSLDLKKIDELAEARSFYKARKILEPLLEAHPKDPQVHTSAGRLFAKMGLLPRAIDEYESVIALEPANVSAYIELSRAYLAREDSNHAMIYARQALKYNPKSAEARLLLVRILMAKSLLLEAEQELQRLLRGDPNDAQVHFMAANIYRERGQGALALGHVEKAIQLDPEKHDWLLEKSDICILLNRYDDAKSSLERLLQYEPDSVEGLNRLARVKENSLRDYDGAMDCYRRVIEIDPDSVTALAGIERLKAKKNDLAGLWKHQLRTSLSKLINRTKN
ncbi:MAG: tetratricopeptide repeat protein [Candidatus Melainabacteria bacterium]|nr:tetratricopeptide repeat protein [Candidatus Melainabacteria bacterium]